MNRQEYGNPLGNQVKSLPQLVDEQVKRCFDEKKIQELISVAEIFDVRKIYITGAGDSIAAAGAFAEVIQKFAGVFHCEAIEPMEYTRFMTASDIGIGEPNSPLVIAISAGGGTARVKEAILKTNELGAMSLLITNKKESASSEVAKKVFYLDVPPMEKDFPGLRSYFAGMIGLLALATRMGRVRNVLAPEKPEEIRQAICKYVHSWETEMDRIDEQMFALAQKWKDLEKYNFIGCGADLSSALFASEKFYECNGVIADYTDAEDWCHIDYFLKNPQEIGTVIFADRHAPEFGRVKETIQAAAAIGRPVLVITNAEKEEFDDRAEVCEIPDTPTGYEWLAPLMNYAPAAILSGYCCTLSGRKFFNEYDPIVGEYNGSGRYFDKKLMTTGSSAIEIHI